MFRKITRLLFGGEEETSNDELSGEVVEEGWLMINHQEATSTETYDVEEITKQSNPVAEPQTDNSVKDSEVTLASGIGSNGRAISALVSQLESPAEVAQVTCSQRAKSLVNRHHTSRNALQRQNRIRQVVVYPSFNLQQPWHRNLSH